MSFNNILQFSPKNVNLKNKSFFRFILRYLLSSDVTVNCTFKKTEEFSNCCCDLEKNRFGVLLLYLATSTLINSTGVSATPFGFLCMPPSHLEMPTLFSSLPEQRAARKRRERLPRLRAVSEGSSC